MRINPASNLPVFEQVADSIRSAIAAGAYLPGELIPSIRQQATTLLINPNTIKHAYDALEREGIIQARSGLGMAVTPRAAAIARSRVEQSLKSSFTDAIRLGRSSRMGKAGIDEVYRKSWSDIPSDDGSAR